MFKSNQKGFTLIEIMLALSMASLLAMVVVNLVGQMNKAQKNAEIKSTELHVWNQIISFVSTNNTCNSAFVGFRPGDNFDILEVTATGAGLRLEKDKELGNSGLYTTKMSLLANPEALGTDGEYYLTFQLNTIRKAKGQNTGIPRAKKFNFRAQLCEPTVTIYRNPFEYSTASSACTTAAGTSYHWKEPSTIDASGMGAFICYICGPNKTVLTCRN